MGGFLSKGYLEGPKGGRSGKKNIPTIEKRGGGGLYVKRNITQHRNADSEEFKGNPEKGEG